MAWTHRAVYLVLGCGASGCFLLLATVTKAAGNSRVQVFMGMDVFIPLE